ncbi:hypothetical protein IP84_16430 [beta proteobacterium AAP99]|nr:hypothetical protein IP84_16430 [beta proteobacterium AAP99]
MRSELEALQARFGAALRMHDAAGALLPELEGDAERNARRIGLYRGNVMANATRTLGASYPVTRQMLGHEFFDAMAPHFWRAHPAQEGDWALWGSALDTFAAQFEPTAGFAWLPPLARLEWVVHEAQFAPDATAEQIEAAAENPLIIPGSRVLAESVPIVTLWRAHQPGAEIDLSQIDLQAAEGALVLRQGFAVQVFPLPFDQASTLIEHLMGEPT